MAFDFLNPAMFWGLAALAAPLVIHLLTRGSRHTVFFPTLRFLRRTLARQSRLRRLRHLVLLLLRMLLLALAATAFAKPVMRLPFQRRLTRRHRSVVLLALDTSLSMSYTGSGAAPLSRAKAEAERILRRLGTADRANILFVSSTVRSAAPRPTHNLNLLRQELDLTRPTQERADFNAALTAAADQFTEVDDADAALELYFLSDFQRTNWANVNLRRAPANARLYLVDVDSEAKRNTALTRLEVHPTVPRLGETVEVVAEVSNFSAETKQVPVDVTAEGQARRRKWVLAPAFGSVTVRFRYRWREPGWYRVTAALPADGLEADNTRYVVVRMHTGLSVFLVADADPADSRSAPFYLRCALNPGGKADTGIRVRTLTPAQARRTPLTEAEVILLADVYQPDEELMRKLYEYATSGGCLFYFLGRGQVDAQLAALDRVSGDEPAAPFAVARLLDLHGMGRGYVTVAEARFESPLLKLFRNPELGDLSSLRFYKLRLVTTVAPRAEVLLRFDDRTVGAARQRVGQGSVILCNFSPEPEFTDMVKHELFPALLHEWIRGALAEAAPPQDFRVAQVASASLPAAPSTPKFSFRDPGGRQIDARWQRVGRQTLILFEQTPRAGYYTALLEGRPAAVVAVNVSPEESDLRELDAAELTARRQVARRSRSFHADRDPAYVDRVRHGRPMWPALLLAALCVALVEQALAYALRTP